MGSLMSRGEESACVSSVLRRPQCNGGGSEEVGDAQGRLMHNGNISSAHSGFIHSASTLFCSFPLLFYMVDNWMVEPPPLPPYLLLIMFVSSQCAFGVAVPDWPESENAMSVWGEEDWPVSGANGSGSGS